GAKRIPLLRRPELPRRLGLRGVGRLTAPRGRLGLRHQRPSRRIRLQRRVPAREKQQAHASNSWKSQTEPLTTTARNEQTAKRPRQRGLARTARANVLQEWQRLVSLRNLTSAPTLPRRNCQ